MRGRSARSRWRWQLRHSADQHARALAGQRVARFEQKAVAGACNIGSALHLAVERDDPAPAVLKPVPAAVNQSEGRTIDQHPLFGGRNAAGRSCAGPGVSDPDGLLDVQLARAAVVIEAVGDVHVLLEFEQGEPAADCVDRARRDEDEIAGADRAPVDQLLDRPVACGGAELVARD